MNLPKLSKDQIKKVALSGMGFVFLLYVYFTFFLGPLQKIRDAALAEIDPGQPLVNVRTMEDNMAATVAQPRFRTWLIGIFAALALLLAAVGIYGVMSYSVTQRTSEIGIRVTLGAQPVDVFRIVVGEGLRFALIGVVVGLTGGLILTRLLGSFLYGVSASDPLTFTGVALLLVLVSAAASFFPARRATRVDPIVALRYE